MTSEPADRTGRPAPTGSPVVAAVLLLGGTALRVALGFESFWLDEAWSHALATQAGSALAIFDIRHDNNHPLNTLYLYAVCDWVGDAHWILYRVPALAAGVGSLLVLWRLAARYGRHEALVVLGLAAASFPLASASAQARGYSVAILCGIGYAALALREPAGQGGRRRQGGRDAAIACGLAAIAVAGLLSHGTFVYTWAAVVACCAVRDGARRLVVLHAVPLLVLVSLYAFFYAGLEVGGGPSYDRFVAIRQAIAQTMALPRRGPLTWVATALALALVVRGLLLLIRAGDRRAIFFAVALAIAPGLVIAATDPKLFYARYLLGVFPWFYWIVAIVVVDELGRGALRRVLACGLLAFFVGANLWHGVAVLSSGRNDYVRTLEYIDEHTLGSSLEVGSDHDFRNAAVLRFHANRVRSGRPLVYLKRGQWPESGPEWYLRHDWKAGHDPERFFSPAPGLLYERVASFEHGRGDGFQWFVYRRLTPPASPGAASSKR